MEAARGKEGEHKKRAGERKYVLYDNGEYFNQSNRCNLKSLEKIVEETETIRYNNFF